MFSFQVWMDEDEDIALDNRVGSPTHWKQIERVFDWTQVRPKTERRGLNPIIAPSSPPAIHFVCFLLQIRCVSVSQPVKVGDVVRLQIGQLRERLVFANADTHRLLRLNR
jgi:hypothetical protein